MAEVLRTLTLDDTLGVGSLLALVWLVARLECTRSDNTTAHKGIVKRLDALSPKVQKTAEDVAYLRGRRTSVTGRRAHPLGFPGGQPEFLVPADRASEPPAPRARRGTGSSADAGPRRTPARSAGHSSRAPLPTMRARCIQKGSAPWPRRRSWKRRSSKPSPSDASQSVRSFSSICLPSA